LFHDIHEALALARDHGNSVPPVRVLRILAGEGYGQFSSVNSSQESSNNHGSIPLSVAMDYVGATLDESSTKIQRLQVTISLLLALTPLLLFTHSLQPFHKCKNNVEEYSRLCCDMEMEIDALLSSGMSKKEGEGGPRSLLPNVDIDEMYSTLMEFADTKPQVTSNDLKEAFWREMEHSDDPFQTVCFFLSRGHLEDI
jgi:hypothetical protein